MSFLRFILLSSFLAVVGCLAYVFFSFDEGYQIEQVFQAFQSKSLKEARIELEKIREKIPPSEAAYIDSYLLRAEHALPAAKKALEQALIEAPEGRSVAIHQNRAINALISRDFASLQAICKHLDKLPQNNYSPFFSGLEAFLDKNYPQAIEKLQAPIHDEKIQDPWLKVAFQKNCPPLLRSLLLARSTLSQSPESARSVLEAAQQQGDYPQLAALFLGLSFLEEAKSKSYPANIPYLTMAKELFAQVPQKDPFLELEQQQIAKDLTTLSQSFIDQGDFQNLSITLPLLTSWKEISSLSEISDYFLHKVHASLGSEASSQLIDQIKEALLHSSALTNLLNQKVEKTLREALEQKQWQQFQQYWGVGYALSSSPNLLANQFVKEVEQTILKQLSEDEASLSQTKALITIYDNLQRDADQRYLFASQLVAAGTGLWVGGHSPQKAYELFLLAEQIPYFEKKQELTRSITQFLQEAYLFARNNDDMENLPYITQAMDYFGIKLDHLDKPVEISNQIADIQQLLQLGRSFEALKKAEWVLQLDTSNQDAHRLKGIAAYMEGLYELSVESLASQKELSPKEKEALAISYIFTEETEKGKELLLSLSNEIPLSDFAWEQLAVLSLLGKDYTGAFSHLKNIEKPVEETLAYLCITAQKVQKPHDSLYYYSKLPSSYQKAPLLRYTQFLSYRDLNDLHKAEYVLDTMSSHLKTDLRSFPPNFRKIHSSLWQERDFYETASLFYEKQKPNPKKALEYLDKISASDPSSQLRKAQAYIHLGRTSLARDLLSHLPTAPLTGSSLRMKNSLEFSLLKAENKPLAALSLYQAAPTTFDFDVQRSVAQLYMQQNAPSLASKTWEQLLGVSPNNTALDQLSYIQSLAQAGQLPLAIAKLSPMKKMAPGLSSQEKIFLIDTILKMQGPYLAKQFLSDLPPFSVQTKEEVLALTSLYIALKDQTSTDLLVSSYLQKFEEDAEGMELLLQAYLLLDQPENLQAAAQAMVERYPRQALCSTNLWKAPLEANQVERLHSVFQLLLHQNKDALPWDLLQSIATNRKVASWSQEAFNHAGLELIKLSQKFPDLAFLAHTQANWYLQADFPSKALHAAQRATSLAPFKAENYQLLATCHSQLGNQQKALQTLQQASHYLHLPTERSSIAIDAQHPSIDALKTE